MNDTWPQALLWTSICPKTGIIVSHLWVPTSVAPLASASATPTGMTTGSLSSWALPQPAVTHP